MESVNLKYLFFLFFFFFFLSNSNIKLLNKYTFINDGKIDLDVNIFELTDAISKKDN